MADAKTLNKRQNRRKAAKEAPKEPAKEAKARRNKRKERKKGPKTPKARQQERDANSKEAQKERDAQAEDQEQAPKQAQTPATPQADAGQQAADQGKDPSKADAKGPLGSPKAQNTAGSDSKTPGRGTGRSLGDSNLTNPQGASPFERPIGGPLSGGQRAVDQNAQDLLGETPIAQAESMSTDVPTQYVLHKQWQQTPLGQGAGDYSTYGEAFSPERLDATLNSILKGVGQNRGSLLGFGGGLLAHAADFVIPQALKIPPFIGELVGIFDILATIGTFDFTAFGHRLLNIADGEQWDDNPWGTLADGFMLLRDALNIPAVLVNLVDVIQGFLSIPAETVAAATTAAGGTGAPVLAALTIPDLVLATLSLEIAAAQMLLASQATICRSIGALTQDGDARQINETLTQLENDSKSTVSDTLSTALKSVAFGRKVDKAQPKKATSKTDTADKTPKLDQPADQSNLGSTSKLLPASNKVLSGFSMDGSAQQAVQRPARWVQGESMRYGTLTLLNALMHHVETQSIRIPHADATKPLPEAPHEPQDVDAKRSELHQIDGQGKKLALWSTQIDTKMAEAEQHKALATTATNKGKSQQSQLDPIDAQLNAKGQKQARASAEYSKVESNQAQDAQQLKNKTLGQMRTFVAGLSKVPDALLPSSISKDLAKVRALLGKGKEEGSSPAELKSEQNQGKAQMDSSAQALNEAEQRTSKARQEGQHAEAKGQALETKVQAHQSALAQQKTKTEADAKALRARAEQLQSEIKEAEQSMDAWAHVHEATAAHNDLIADVLIDGAEISDDGTQQTLSKTQASHVRAAMDDTSDCIMFCRRCLSEGAVLVNDRSGGVLQFIERGKTKEELAGSATSGRGAAGVATEGIEDLDAIRAELSQVTPENYAEVLGKAFDTTGRIRKRLKLMPKAKKGFGDIKLPTPEIPDPTPEEPKPTPKPPAPAPTAVFFSHNQPTPGVGKGPVLAPEKAGQSKKALQDYTAYFSQGRGGSVNMVGFASVEGSKTHNEQLAARRIDFVEGSLTEANVQTNRALAVSALVEGEGDVNEPGTPAFDEANGEGYEHSFWRKVTLEVGQEPEFEGQATSEASEVS